MFRWWRCLRFWDAAARRKQLREDLKSQYNTERAIADARRDVLLERDLKRLWDEEGRKKQK